MVSFSKRFYQRFERNFNIASKDTIIVNLNFDWSKCDLFKKLC